MIRAFLAALVFLAAAGAGCTLTPVYGPAAQADASQIAFRYAKPATRLDQIVTQELSLRFARAEALTAPQLSITTTVTSRSLGRTETQALGQREATIIATATVTAAGQPPYVATRRASALYTSSDQVLAEVSAQEEAQERAARAAAESLRLTLLAHFAAGLPSPVVAPAR